MTLVYKYDFSKEKDLILKETRGVGFRDIIEAIESGNLIDAKSNPNQKKYPGQKLYIVRVGNYVYSVPYVVDHKRKVFFLKLCIRVGNSQESMKNKKIDPFKNLILDDYEQEIEDALEKGEFVSDPNFKKNKKIFEEAAKRYIELQESKSVTLRLKKKDLIKLKAKAARNSIPYQTLIGLLINSYTEGKTKLTL